MSRSPLSTGALVLTAALVLGVSAGPATADPPDTARPVPTATSSPAPPTPDPTGAEPTETEPTDAAPTPLPTTPAPAVPDAEVDLRIAVVYEKPAYAAHEEVRARATVTNVGTATATGVTVMSTGNLHDHEWSGLGGPGVTLEPGRSVEGTADGDVVDPGRGEVRLVVTTSSIEPETTPADNTVVATVPVHIVRGTYAGVVYGDNDGSGAKEPGEELSNLTVRLIGGHPGDEYTVATDLNGRFEFADVPLGWYVVLFSGSDWWLPTIHFELDEVDDPEALIRGARRVGGQLTATAAFTRPAYAVDETAVMALTLTNGDDPAIPGLKALCHSPLGVPVDLGELGREEGTSLPGRTTKTYFVTYRVTDAAVRAGHMAVNCVVGSPPWVNGEIKAGAVARVPGAHAARALGRLLRVLPRDDQCGRCPPPTVPLVGVKVYLRSQLTGQVVARAVTGAQGLFQFSDLPADLYDFGVVGPWKAPATFVVAAGDNTDNPTTVLVEVGPDQPDPDPVPPDAGPPPGGAPAPPGDDPGDLAVTGAGVGWLALTGLLALVAGVVLVSRAGRRT
ncbi:hypothetical protein [Actinosynnema sp. NPDC023587]|uniref:hypothetical protein n=1 Tax=Actinosynnema sp. NPDC023587 TaxID=3154695 RepID=UPI0033C8371B